MSFDVRFELPPPEDVEESRDIDSQTFGLWVSLILGTTITFLCLLAFDPLRRRFPSVFETRRKLNQNRDPLDYLGNRVTTPPAPSYKTFGWLLPTLRLDLEKLTDTHGLDAALFLRYHRIMFSMFSVMLIPSIILIPVFYTGPNKNLHSKHPNVALGINMFSIGNVEVRDPWRFWVVLAVEYAITIFVCYHISNHFTLYCRDRRRYRAARHPANYAVLVQDVPYGARNAEAVKNYWDRVFPGEIATVFYVHDARRLEKWKERFWRAVSKREVAELHLHRAKESEKENAEKERIKRSRKSVRRRRNAEHNTTETQEHLEEVDMETQGPTTYAPPPQPEAVYNPYAAQNMADNAMADVDAMLDDNGEIESPDKEEEVTSRMCGIIPMQRRIKTPKDPEAAVRYWEKVQRREWAKVAAYQRQRDEGHFQVTTSAIVVFKSRRSAAIASQTNFSRKEDEWRVTRAPEPNAINWGALCVTGWTIYVRQAITWLLSTALTILWIFPLTFIMGLVSFSKLVKLEINGSQPLKFLEFILDMPEYVVKSVESLLPAVILSLFLSWVPSIFKIFVGISRITSFAEQDRQVRDWYFAFETFSNFLFITFAGTLIRSFSSIMDKPKSAVDILAKNVPIPAAFIMNYILIVTLTEVPRELLQLGRVITRKIKLKFIAHTQRQREEADVGEMDMDYITFYATSQLIGLLGLVYSTIQPFVTLCCMGYFALTYVVFKYNLCYSLYNEYDDGGRMYGGALYSIWVGLFSHLMTMIGLFSLNKSPAQSVLIIIPAVLSVMFLLHCRKSFGRVLEHGSSLETQDRIEELEGCSVDVVEDELASTYEHPGWEELPKYNELENLNGVTTEEDLAKAAEKEAMLDFMTESDMTTTFDDRTTLQEGGLT